MNLCRLCIWNKDEHQKQLTIIFHINDIMIVHAQRTTATDCVKLLDNNYGSKDPLTMTREKIYEYLSVTIGFSLRRGFAMR